MPKTADRPEVLTLAGAQWTRDPDDAARMESWPDGHVRMRADDLRRLDEHQAAADERERAQRAAAEREYAAFLARPRVTLRGQEWVRHNPRNPGSLCSADRTVTAREATLREMDARDAADAQRAADQQAARRRSIQDQLTELQRQIDATPATP
jgi:hypothetical protein